MVGTMIYPTGYNLSNTPLGIARAAAAKKAPRLKCREAPLSNACNRDEEFVSADFCSARFTVRKKVGGPDFGRAGRPEGDNRD